MDVFPNFDWLYSLVASREEGKFHEGWVIWCLASLVGLYPAVALDEKLARLEFSVGNDFLSEF